VGSAGSLRYLPTSGEWPEANPGLWFGVKHAIQTRLARLRRVRRARQERFAKPRPPNPPKAGKAANGWLLARRKGLCPSMRVCIEWLVAFGDVPKGPGQHQANTRPTPAAGNQATKQCPRSWFTDRKLTKLTIARLRRVRPGQTLPSKRGGGLRRISTVTCRGLAGTSEVNRRP
jgi:hypothetical protein